MLENPQEVSANPLSAKRASKGFYFIKDGVPSRLLNFEERERPTFYQDVAGELGVESKDVLKSLLVLDQVESEFHEIVLDELIKTLGLTIKRDDLTKAIAFLAVLTNYSAEEQNNILFCGESSLGKSYIGLEIASYFPQENLLIIGYSSPTAFIHDVGLWDNERKVVIVNLERKIIVFTDQPAYELLERLRPVLSHDRKELEFKITDRSKRGSNRTKNVIIRGYPTVIFCSARSGLKPEELTRNFILSPSDSQEKLEESIRLIAEKDCNRDEFRSLLASNPSRNQLMRRVKAIRDSNIRDVVVEDGELLAEAFLAKHKGKLSPRNQRDFPRLIKLIKGLALLNWRWREKVGEDRIKANQADVETALKLYGAIAVSNELGLTPQTYEIYEKVFKPLLVEGQGGVHRKTILIGYSEKFKRPLGYDRLTKAIIPELVSAGLIVEQTNPEDRRETLIYPVSFEESTNLMEAPRVPTPLVHTPLSEYNGNETSIGDVHTPSPLNQGSSAKQNIGLPEILNALHSLSKFVESDFVEHTVKLGLREEQGVKLFWWLVDEGSMLRDPDGFWRWMR